jgi:hypothetical protein
MTKHHTSTIGNASKMHFKIIVLPFSFTFLLWRSKYLTKQPKQVELEILGRPPALKQPKPKPSSLCFVVLQLKEQAENPPEI